MNSVSAGVQVQRGLVEIRSIDIGNEAERHRAVAERAQRTIGHLGPQVGPADADIHDVADALAGMSGEFAAAQARGERRHRVQHPVDIGHHIGAIDLDAGVARRAQRHMQNGAAFGGVDYLAGKHRVAPLRHAALVRQPQQQPQRLIRDAVLRVVEEQARPLGREAFGAAGIVGEQRAQMHVLDLRMMRRQRLPGSCVGQRGHRCSPGFRPATLLLASIAPSSSFHDLTKLLAPSDCNCAASAVRSMPALTCAASTASASPPSRASALATLP